MTAYMCTFHVCIARTCRVYNNKKTTHPAPEKLQNGRDIIIDWFLKVSTYNLK